MALFGITKYVLVPLFTEWLSLDDFVYLDSALCSKVSRERLFDLSSQFPAPFEDNLIAKTSFSVSYRVVRWITLRSLHTSSIIKVALNDMSRPHDSNQFWQLFPNLRVLKVDTCPKHAIKSVVSIVNRCDKLEEVFFTNCQTSFSFVAELTNYSLSVLDLSGIIKAPVFFENSFLSFISQSPKLKTLDVNVTLTPKMLMACAVHCPLLTVLKSHGGFIGQAHGQALERYQQRVNFMFALHCRGPLSHMTISGTMTPLLRRLMLARQGRNVQQLTAYGVVDSLVTTSCRRLTNLTVICPQLFYGSCVVPMEKLTMNCPIQGNLASLEFYSHTLREFTFLVFSRTKCEMFAQLATCSQLRKLDLAVAGSEHSDLTDDTVLAVAKSCCLLEEVNLSGHDRLTDRSIVEIALGCRSLQVIELLDCSKITNESVMAFAEYSEALQSIELGHCSLVTDVAMAAMVSKMGLRLRRLSVTNCTRLTAVTLEMLMAKCLRLEYLCIRGILSLDERTVARLVCALPRLNTLRTEKRSVLLTINDPSRYNSQLLVC